VRDKFLQAVLVVVVAFLVFKYGVQPPMPFSLLSLYMAITLLAVLVYVSSDSDSWRAFVRPIWATLVEPRRRPLRLLLGVLIPLLVGYYAYSQASAKTDAPFELRSVHPAPPSTISFRGKTIDVESPETPVRKDVAANPVNWTKHLAAGGAVYIRNCVYCHGDNLDGGGHFAHGLNPVPANFTDPGTIAQLSEGYLFWRIAKGGPGLPKEGTPWNSAMPAWEDRLTEEQIWQVIYYLYETTGYPPAVRRADHAALPAPPRAPLLAALGSPVAQLVSPRPATAQQAGDSSFGKQLYERKCALCHGASGKGDGPAAELLLPRPRDFTAGKYKIRSTNGALPSDEDLFRVITEGMPGTSMPAWTVLPEADRRALVAYVKSFSDAFKEAKPEPASFPQGVAPSEASIRRGRKMFEAFECNKCHGQAGRGDPAPGSDLKDDWGHPIRPANLHKAWTFRGGPERKDVVMRLTTGMTGTPMPSIADAIEDYRKSDEKDSDVKDASLFDLANYVRSLGPDRPNWATVLSVRAATGEVSSDPHAKFWQDVPGANFPLVGQVIVDPRNFNPTVDMITVRAAYTRDEVVFHLTWDDPTPSDPTKGAPKPDMVALQFPAGDAGGERPYFLMGDGGKPVYLLTWRVDTGVGEATAAGVGKVTPQMGPAVQAKGEALYEAGQYRAVIRRALRTGDPGDVAFPADQFFPIAFWAWDGGAAGGEGEEGPRAAVSTWYYVRLEAPPSRRQLVIPPIAVLGTVILELGLSRWAQRRRGSRAERG
jgi:DMSO reductase family type II enzyme heme b subunit